MSHIFEQKQSLDKNVQRQIFGMFCFFYFAVNSHIFCLLNKIQLFVFFVQKQILS